MVLVGSAASGGLGQEEHPAHQRDPGAEGEEEVEEGATHRHQPGGHGSAAAAAAAGGAAGAKTITALRNVLC